MNIIVELVKPGRFFKDAPLNGVNEALKKHGFEVVFAADIEDLMNVVKNNARLAGVVIDWEESPESLCSTLNSSNTKFPALKTSPSQFPRRLRNTKTP